MSKSYIRPFDTFPFGLSFSLFKENDTNYYDLDKISEFNPYIKHMDFVEKVKVEQYYNAIRFITYAINQNKTLADIIGYENNIALNNIGLGEINFGKANIIPIPCKL